MRMALSILPESSVISKTRFARLSPSSAMLLSRILLEVVRAVSAEEKKADNNNKIITISNCMTSLVSKYISPFDNRHVLGKNLYSERIRISINILDKLGFGKKISGNLRNSSAGGNSLGPGRIKWQ